MRCARHAAAIAAIVAVCGARPAGGAWPLVHQARYSMGTMFDIVVYHPSRPDAERAIAKAMDEIARLDGVMSNFREDSDLSTLMREGRGSFVPVEPSLYEVIETSIELSRQSHGAFDITVGPLSKLWRQTLSDGARPSETELAGARRCVGYEKIELSAPNRIRLRSDCIEIDLGAIGKGYAVDRAMAILKSAGILHAVVNAGSSSIAAIGAPPGGPSGWPVRIGATEPDREIAMLLRDESISTSKQHGSIYDLRTGAPAETSISVSVVAPSAMVSDGLDTALVLLSIDDGKALLSKYSHVSAFWVSAQGNLTAEYHATGRPTARVR